MQRILLEDDPNTNTSGNAEALTYEEFVGGAWVRYYQYGVMRFLSPDYDDSDPDAVLGYWAIRSPRIRLRVSASIEDGSGSAGTPISAAFQVWLLDQYFDYTAITWNSPPEWTGMYQEITLACTLADGHSAEIVSAKDPDGYAVEFAPPRLADGRPVPIYGAAVSIDVSPATPFIYGGCEIDIMDIADDERVASQYALATDPSWIPYSGEFLPL
jgi:hypothetical protein